MFYINIIKTQLILLLLVILTISVNSQYVQCDTNTGYLTKKLWTGVENITTPQNIQYKFYPLSLISTPYMGCVTFKVRTKSDAHISLNHASEQLHPTLEIVLGGWDNTRSVIRNQYYTSHVIEKDIRELPDTVSETEFREFSISWNDGHIKVFEGDNIQPMLSTYVEYLFPINFLGIFTCCGAVGTWRFEEPKCPEFKDAIQVKCSDQNNSIQINNENTVDFVRLQAQILSDMKDDLKLLNEIENDQITDQLEAGYLRNLNENMDNAKLYHHGIVLSRNVLEREQYLKSKIFEKIKETYYQMISEITSNKVDNDEIEHFLDYKSLQGYHFTYSPHKSHLFKGINYKDDITFTLSKTDSLKAPIFELKLQNNQNPTLWKNFNKLIATGIPLAVNKTNDYVLSWKDGLIQFTETATNKIILKYFEPNMFRVKYLGINANNNPVEENTL